MPQTVTCPACGGSLDVATAAARVAACPYCSNVMVVNEAAIRALGKMALLAETPSCLAVGWPARCQGREIQVLGRLQFRYSAGIWDEWWIRFEDDGSYAWISQDEDEYTLEKPLEAKLHVKQLASIQPGDRVKVSGMTLWVTEIDQAKIVGLQGELPLHAAPQATMRYLDLTDNKHHVTIETFSDGSYYVFLGEHLPRNALVSEWSEAEGQAKHPYPPPLAKQPGDDFAPVVRAREGLHPQAIQCLSCGGSLELRDAEGSALVICGYCGSALNLSLPGKPQLLRMAKQKKRKFPIQVGDRFQHRGVAYTVLGILRYKQREEGVDYHWTAFQLHHPEKGYAFLELENGHWLFFTSLKHAPTKDPRKLRRGNHITFEGQRYRVFERGSCVVDYVEGELSWVARLGDRLEFMDAVRPPFLISAEWSKTEMEWSLGEYLTREQVAKGLSIPARKLPGPRGVAPAQPFARSSSRRLAMKAGAIVGSLLLMLAFFAVCRSGVPVIANQTITDASYLSEQGYISPPFSAPEGEHIYKLEATARSLNNQWVALSAAILDEQERIVLDADATVEYYQGVEGGERWSEGSMHDHVLFRLSGPATYRLNVFGETGSWSPSSGDRPEQSGPPVTISLYCDVHPARYYLWGAILAWLFPAWEIVKGLWFRSRQWSDD